VNGLVSLPAGGFDAAALPSQPGAYALLLCLPEPLEMQPGRLGRFLFPPGDYVYTGSACGPGGLRSRLGRHIRGGARQHWHIDYLRPAAAFAGAVYTVFSDLKDPAFILSPECRWSQVLSARPGAAVPIPGFGAADCRSRCPAHLVHFPSGSISLLTLEKILADNGISSVF
jgi:Uri superfamily endonuclease